MSFEPYKIVIGQVVRHSLTVCATLLGAYGVTEAQQEAVVEASVAIVVAVVVAVATQAWSYIHSKWLFKAFPEDE